MYAIIKTILIRGFVKFFEAGNNKVPKTSQMIAPSKYIYDMQQNLTTSPQS